MAVNVQIVGLQALRSRIRRLADKGSISDALHRNLADAWASGAENFIRVAIRRVLVDTGMSAATFFPLSRAIARVHSAAAKSARAEAAIVRQISANRKSLFHHGFPTFPSGHRRSGIQGESTGEKLGKRAFRFNTGRPTFPVFTFSFQTVAFQHALHEVAPQMRQSLAEGIVAFEETIRIRFIRDANFIIKQWLRTSRAPRGIVRIKIRG